MRDTRTDKLKIGQRFYDKRGTLCKLVELREVEHGERGAGIQYFQQWKGKFGEKVYYWSKLAVAHKVEEFKRHTPLWKVMNG